MRYRVSVTLMAVSFVFLLFSVVAQVWLLPAGVARVVAVFPEVQPLTVPSVIWGVIAIVCLQVAAIIGVRVAVLARKHRLNESAYGWLRAIVGCLLAFLVLVVFAIIALNALEYSTPGLMFGLIGAGLLALIAAGFLVLFLGARSVVRASHS